MAKIFNLSTGETVTLLLQHVFGRHPCAANTLLVTSDCSRIHATVFWDNGDWQLQDESSNGTFINYKQVSPGENNQLVQGDIIHFANLLSNAWQIIDLTPPVSHSS